MCVDATFAFKKLLFDHFSFVNLFHLFLKKSFIAISKILRWNLIETSFFILNGSNRIESRLSFVICLNTIARINLKIKLNRFIFQENHTHFIFEERRKKSIQNLILFVFFLNIKRITTFTNDKNTEFEISVHLSNKHSQNILYGKLFSSPK